MPSHVNTPDRAASALHSAVFMRWRAEPCCLQKGCGANPQPTARPPTVYLRHMDASDAILFDHDDHQIIAREAGRVAVVTKSNQDVTETAEPARIGRIAPAAGDGQAAPAPQRLRRRCQPAHDQRADAEEIAAREPVAESVGTARIGEHVN